MSFLSFQFFIFACILMQCRSLEFKSERASRSSGSVIAKLCPKGRRSCRLLWTASQTGPALQWDLLGELWGPLWSEGSGRVPRVLPPRCPRSGAGSVWQFYMGMAGKPLLLPSCWESLGALRCVMHPVQRFRCVAL